MITRAERVVAVVANRLGLEPAAIMGAGTERKAASARHVCGWLMVNRLGLASAEAARRVNYDHHASMIYALRKVEAHREQDPEFNALLKELGDEVEAAERAAPRLGDVERIAGAMATSRRALIGARIGELQLLAEGFLALLEVGRAAEAMILTDDEEAKAALAEAILEEMAAMRGDHVKEQ